MDVAEIAPTSVSASERRDRAACRAGQDTAPHPRTSAGTRTESGHRRRETMNSQPAGTIDVGAVFERVIQTYGQHWRVLILGALCVRADRAARAIVAASDSGGARSSPSR